MNDGIVIIPTYNEIENIESIIRAVFLLPKPFHILIIDDNSPDNTAEKVIQLQQEFPGRLFIEQRAKKSGLGTAYVHGFKWALEHRYEYVFEMDADFSHNPNDLEKLYDACRFGGNEVAIGSRYVTGVNVVNWPLSRVLLSYFASVYVRMITGMVTLQEVGKQYGIGPLREFAGDAKDVADKMEEWFSAKACDGFMIQDTFVPGGFEDFTRLVIPELQARGLFRKNYEGVTLRDHLGLTRPGTRPAS